MQVTALAILYYAYRIIYALASGHCHLRQAILLGTPALIFEIQPQHN